MIRLSAFLTLFAPSLLAAAPAAATETYILTPEQVEAAMQSASVKPAAVTASEPVSPRRQVHGEVGAMIGTGGARGLFGTMLAPIGDDGFAALQFETTRTGERRIRRR